MRVFGIVGFKNSGKTHLVVDLVRHFSAQGLRVATVKHAHHGFDLDHPGKDSWLHREAGASEVVVASSLRWAHLTELRGETEPTLPELLARIGSADLVLVEGFKQARHPKAQVVRDAQDRLLAAEDAAVKAIVSDLPLSAATVPVLPRGDLPRIASLVLEAAAEPSAWVN